MRKLTGTAFAVLAGGMTVVALGTSSSATTLRGQDAHVMVEGTWSDPGPTIDSITPSGPDFAVALHGNTTVAGPFTGASSYSFTLRVDRKNGKSHGPGQETFTASLDGKGSGTVTFAELLHQDADGSTVVTGTVVSGTGVFQDAHGAMRFVGVSQSGTNTGTGTYRLVLELSA